MNQPVLLNRVIAAVVSFVVTVVLMWSILLMVFADYRLEHRQQMNAFMDEIYAVATDVTTSIQKLNDRGFTVCDNTTLVAMRQVQFQADYVKDIGFTDNGLLICTTGLGLLETPFEGDEPDIVTPLGYKVWPNQPLILFNESYSALVAERGHFNAVFDIGELNDQFPSAFEWFLLSQDGDDIRSVAGNPRLMTYFEGVDFRQSFSLFEQVTTDCVDVLPYCAVIRTESQDLFLSYRLLWLVTLALSLFSLWFVYHSTMVYFQRRNSIENRVRRGYRQQCFYPLYQPIVDLKTKAIVGVEVLARFSDQAGPIYPDEFIPEVAKQGFSWAFTDELMTRAFSELGALEQLPAGFKVSFNLFPRDITSQKIQQVRHNSVVMNSRFTKVLEITENEELNVSDAQKQLEWLASMGFVIAVDDFGTGYSNLNQIRNLHCQYLKIDRTFVMDMEDGSIKSSLIPNIVEIAGQLNLQVVAEGIENVMQETALLNAGVCYGQGWAFGKPMTAEQLIKLPSINSADTPLG